MGAVLQLPFIHFMKKLILMLGVPYLFGSCAEFRAYTHQSAVVLKDSIVHFSNDKMDAVTININGVPHNFQYDTGAGVTVIYNPKFNLEKQHKIRERKIYGFDKKVSSTISTYVIDSMACESFVSLRKYLAVGSSLKMYCGTTAKFDGIVDRFIPDLNAVTDLNYEHGYIRFTTKPDLTGYVPLEAKFTDYNGIFYIKMSINGISDFFMFDTGNQLATLVNKNLYKLEDPLYTLHNLNTVVGGDAVPFELQIFPANCSLKDFKFQCMVAIDDRSERSILNFNFIKQFNWIIDQKNNLVYFKPIRPEQLQSTKEIVRPENIAMAAISNDKLIVGYLNFESERWHLGEEIISVDGKPVNQDNMCDLFLKLNLDHNWNSLNVVTEAIR